MYRIRVKKLPTAKAGLSMGDQSDFGLYVAGPGNKFLPKAQNGQVVDYFKQQMLKNYGKYLVTDKGTNRTYYGYRTPDGKMVENNFEVLTGKTGNNDYYSPYTLEETESKSPAFQNKIRITPVGTFPVKYNPDIYGNPGLDIDNSGGLAMHATYDPAVRNAYYNNNNPYDNYASYGCINCHKPDIDRVLKGFGDNDRVSIVDSRKSIEENNALAKANEYLFKYPEAAKMLFERPGSQIVNREWNAQKGVYEGKDSDYDPRRDMIIDKKALAPAFVVAHKNNSRTLARSIPTTIPPIPTPLQQTLSPSQQSFIAVNNQSADDQGPSIVDYLNNLNIDSGKANRLQMARDLGIDNYNYTANDNLKMLHMLQDKADMARNMQDPSIVDYLNNLNIDSSKANRMKLAHDVGIDNYNYTADDNMKLLRMLQDRADIAKNGRMQTGGTVPANPPNPDAVRQNIQPVNRNEANIEAERGETVTGDFDQDGMTEHLAIGGKRHSEGGTPLNVPSGAFVFSDTKKMKIGGDILQEFGKSGDSKKKFTPAQLAKQYDLNKYKAILQDPNSDRWEKDTAQLMLDNNQTKLGKLALLQEGMKGFPNGVPSIAMPYLSQLASASNSVPVSANITTSGQPAPTAPPVPPAPAMQTGGSVGRPLYSQDLINDAFTGVDNQQTTYPSYIIKNGKPVFNVTVPTIQSKRKEGTFGTLNMDMNDFYTRHPWVKEANPNFNPSNPKDVTWFQNEYNKRYESILGRNYFNGIGHRMVDGKFGQGTYSAPAIAFNGPTPEVPRHFPEPDKDPYRFDYGPPEIPDVSKTGRKPYPIPGAFNPNSAPPSKVGMPWWTQDEINFFGALGNRYNLKKYMPTYVSPAIALPTPTFFDPTRQLVANQEQAAAQNAAGATFSGGSRWRAVGSNIQGQAAANAANILGQVANQNVGIANQFANTSAEYANTKAMQDAGARTNFLAGLATVNQQFDNSKAAANNIARANLLSGISNAEKTYWLNRTNNQFNIDPSTGQLSFVKGKWLGDRGSAGSSLSPAQLYAYHYKDFVNSNPGIDKVEDKAHEYAMRRIQSLEKTSNVDPQMLASYMSQLPRGSMGYPSGYGGGYAGSYPSGYDNSEDDYNQGG